MNALHNQMQAAGYIEFEERQRLIKMYHVKSDPGRTAIYDFAFEVCCWYTGPVLVHVSHHALRVSLALQIPKDGCYSVRSAIGIVKCSTDSERQPSNDQGSSQSSELGSSNQASWHNSERGSSKQDAAHVSMAHMPVSRQPEVMLEQASPEESLPAAPSTHEEADAPRAFGDGARPGASAAAAAVKAEAKARAAFLPGEQINEKLCQVRSAWQAGLQQVADHMDHVNI